MVAILGPELEPPNPMLAAEIVRWGRPSAAVLPPYLTEDIVRIPEVLDSLSSLDYVFYGSAPLSTSAGNKLCEVVKLQPIYGTTEITFPLICELERDDWEYLWFHPDPGLEMVYRTSELCELVVARREEEAKWKQPVFHVFPESHAYFTKDLFSEHPTKPGVWKYRGRSTT